MNGIETRFKIGNKAGEVWSREDVETIMDDMRKNASEDDTILCLQDAIRSVNLYSSGLNYLLGRFPEFEIIKKDIQDIIIGRVNSKALNGFFNAAASIWRMKQCGERDESQINHQNDGGKFDTPRIVFKKSYDE